MTTRNDITGDPIKTKGRLSEEGRDNWDRIFGHKKEAEVSDDLILSVEDRLGMDISAWEDAVPVEPPSEYELSIARKMKEWELMYECLKSMHLYEYPVEEAKEVLKRIEDEK